MGGLSEVVSVGGKLVEFGGKSEWLQPLEELGEKWQKIGKQVEDLAQAPKIESIEGLVKFLNGKLDNDLVKDAFAKIDLEGLRDELGKFIGLYESMPEEVKQLASPVSKAGTIKLPIVKFSEEKAGPAGKGSFHLALDGSLTTDCETGSKWPVASDKIDPGLLRLGVVGKIEAGTGGKLPFNGGAVGLSVGASVGAKFDLYHRPPVQERLLASELARHIPQMPNPFDLGSVWDAMELGHLQGLILSLDGHAEVEAELSVGKEIDLPEVLSGKLEIVASVSLKRKAAYKLTVLSIENAQLLVSLSRDKESVNAWSMGLGLELDISPLVGRIQGELEGALGGWSERLEEIKPYLTPGTFIQKKFSKELGGLVEELVKDENLRAGIIQDLGILIGTVDADESALVNALKTKLTDKLNVVSGLAQGKADDVAAKANEVVDGITNSLPTLAQDHAQTILKKKIAELIAGFKVELDKKIKDITPDVPADDIGKALKSIGVKVKKQIKTADDAAAGIRQLVDDFDTLLHKVAAAVKKAGEEKIGAQLYFEESRTSGAEVEVVGAFSNSGTAAASIYASIVRGQLSVLQKLFEGPTVEGFALDTAKSSIRRFAKVSKKTGYAFVGLGIELKGYELLSADVEIVIRGNGDVAVVSKGEIKKGKSGPREGREVALISTYNLLLARAEDDDGNGRKKSLQKAMTLGLTASHMDKDLEASEVTGFLGRLMENGLIHPDRLARAEKTYDKWHKDAGGDGMRLAGDITVELSLSAVELQNMLKLGAAIRKELNKNEPMDKTAGCFDLAIDAVLGTGRIDTDEFVRVLRQRRKDVSGKKHPEISDREWLHQKVQLARRAGKQNTSMHHKKVRTIDAFDQSAGKSRAVNIPMESMNALADILQLMSEIYEASPQIDHGKGWSKDDYAKHEVLLMTSSGRWMDLGGNIFSFRKKMGHRTLGFLMVLVALAKGCSLVEVKDGALGNDMVSITMKPGFGPETKQIPVKI